MRPRTPAPVRFFAKVTKTDACWTWTGAIDPGTGYGRFVDGDQRAVLAHRWSYEHHVAPIGAELTVDHLCRNTACVNPAHMEIVSRAENARRGNPNTGKTHCADGHPFDDLNTYLTASGSRDCRICRKRRNAEAYARRKEARRAA